MPNSESTISPQVIWSSSPTEMRTEFAQEIIHDPLASSVYESSSTPGRHTGQRPFTLPEDLSSISDIQKVDLTSLGWNLGGDVSVFEQTPKIKQLNVAPPLSRECYLA